MSDKDYLIKGEMYQYNLGWLIEELMSFKQDLATAIDLKTIKYADPIQWDITTQYPANTVVVDPKSGTAYMSKVPVPAGVELTNTNYWVVVFNYQDIYNKIMDGVAFNDRDQDYATKDLLVNDLVWYAGDLYRVTRAIPTGSKYIPGTNLVKTTIESLLARYYGRDRTAQISNDTVNVSGDYTLVAGDIAETSTNRTIKVTKDREVDVDGSDSVHVDGASTLNVGGLRTEVYAGDKTEGVTGAYTGKYGSASFETGAPSWLVKFPNKTVDMADIFHKPAYLFTPSNAADIGAELNAALANGNVSLASGDYTTSVQIYIPVGHTLYGNNATIHGSFNDHIVKMGADPTIGDSNYALTGITDITIECGNIGDGILINTKRGNIDNVKIRNAKTVGIDIFPADRETSSPADSRINNVDIIQDNGLANITTYGIRINGTDNNISMVRTLYTKIGFYLSTRGASTFFSDCHPLAFSSEMSGWTDSIGWDDYSGNTFISNCYADNFATCYKMEASNALLSIMGLKYFCWEYNNTATRVMLSLASGCFVNALGLDAPYTSYVKKVDFPGSYFYNAMDRVNLSFISSNEPANWREDDFGNMALTRYYKRYFREFSSDTTAWHLIAVVHLINADMASSPINITADAWGIHGIIVNKGGFLSYGTGNSNNKKVSLELRKNASDTDANTLYLYAKYEDGWFGRCLCEVDNAFMMLPRLWNPATEPGYILATHSYYTEA